MKRHHQGSGGPLASRINENAKEQKKFSSLPSPFQDGMTSIGHSIPVTNARWPILLLTIWIGLLIFVQSNNGNCRENAHHACTI
ncbi:hypothetical protein CU048_01955 [Beijerinckiaceae bacterium]|nr:hypothetical protein CU048_01955 [Beijerinckiaceae bacterium]